MTTDYSAPSPMEQDAALVVATPEAREARTRARLREWLDREARRRNARENETEEATDSGRAK